MEICKKCDGKGWIVPDNAYEPGTPDNVKCPDCGGEGWV